MLPLLQYHSNHPPCRLQDEVYVSPLMKDIYTKAQALAQLDNPVIIVGEIGTGKKHMSRYIHRHSNRKNEPFHCFYCVDIDEDSYKEAFWEHVEIQGSHIVLTYDAIEKAAGGILYLDQFSEIEERFMLDIIESYQQGCRQIYRFNMSQAPRLFISINRESYRKMIGHSTWKALLDMLNPLVIMIPPLRERREDIPGLISLFMQKIRYNREQWFNLSISHQAMEACLHFNWPGNVRQLKNALLQGAILSNGKQIEVQHLPFSLNWRLPYRLGKD